MDISTLSQSCPLWLNKKEIYSSEDFGSGGWTFSHMAKAHGRRMLHLLYRADLEKVANPGLAYGEHGVVGFVGEGGESFFTTFKTSTSLKRALKTFTHKQFNPGEYSS